MSDTQDEFERIEERRQRLRDSLLKRANRFRKVQIDKQTDSGSKRVEIARKGHGEPEDLKRHIKGYMKSSGLQWMQKHRDLLEAWHEVVGPEIGEQTKVVSLRAGVLTVDVTSNALKQELENFYKASLLESLRTAHPQTAWREIRFRLAARTDK